MKNPLEVSVLNISTVLKRDKRSGSNKQKEKKINQENLLEKSSLESLEIDEGDLENLLLHNSDKIIKPIIGNKLIETLPQTTYTKFKIQNTPIWKSEKIKEHLRQSNIKPVEQYLLGVYSCMENYYYSNNEEGLLNVLNYFETIIQDKEIANKIINTSFITLLILILKNLNANKQVCYLVKIRICTIIAYLIRYSTMIDTPLDELELCSILENLVEKGKTLEMSKRAIATLGEYLFFVATQAEGAEGDEIATNWIVSEDSLKTLFWALEPSRDEVVKFYALKSIENISALTTVAEMYFANVNFLTSVIDIYLNSKLYDLRICACYTMGHLLRLNPKLFEVFLSKIPFSLFLNKLTTEAPKIQQALINCLIFGAKEFGAQLMENFIINIENSGGFEAYFLKDNGGDFGSLIINLIENIDSSSHLIKMKTILFFKYLLTDIKSIILFNEMKLFQTITKLKKDPNLELRQSIQFFEYELVDKITEGGKLFKSTLTNVLSNINNNKNFNPKTLKDFPQAIEVITSCLKFFSIISNMSHRISSTLYEQNLLERLIEALYCNYLIEEESIQLNLLTIISNFSENRELVEKNSDFIISKMFIPILECCYMEKLENRAIPLTISANIITLLLDDEKLYSSTVLEEGKTKLINGLIIEILPVLRELLTSEELVFSALSFLCLILERNSAFVQYYKTEKIIDRIFILMQGKLINF